LVAVHFILRCGIAISTRRQTMNSATEIVPLFSLRRTVRREQRRDC
jgi:hypothetical protein